MLEDIAPEVTSLAAGSGLLQLSELAGEDFVSYPPASAVATVSFSLMTGTAPILSS